MVKVQFDHQVFSFQEFGGISRYFAALSTYLEKNPNFDHKLKLLYSRNGYLSPSNSVFHPRPGSLFFEKHLAYFLNQKYSERLLSLNDFDVFHPTYYNPYFLKKLKKPFVITVHDMIHELYPECFSKWDNTISRKKKVIERADHIIAISEATKNDLQRLLSVPDSKISVIHHGLFNSIPVENESINPGFHKLKDFSYLLFIGSRKGYKNFDRFIEAAAPLLHHNASFSIICAGGGNFTEKELKKMNALKIKDKVIQVSATENELNDLYTRALFFVYPSIYEGFGLPILEAFHNGCPVAVSNTSCFPEVGGDAVVYFNPLDLHDMNKVMQTLAANIELRTKLSQKGSERLSVFSTNECMEKTAAVYKSLV
jgi:glycosyltransferase involved in cell wall biosynthesis